MAGETINLIACAVLGCATVLIFRPDGWWVRMVVGASMGLLMWVVHVTAVWWSYRA